MERLCKGLVCLLMLRCLISTAEGFNITQILAPYSNFGLFNQWLTLTGVADEVNNHTSITVLATPDAALQPYVSVAQSSGNLTAIADTLRYQVLLTYYGWPELQEIPQGNFSKVTTLLQTTGRYNTTQGFVDIYNNGSQYIVGHFVPDSYGNKTIQGNITQQLYVYSVMQVSGLLLPVPESGLVPSPAPIKPPVSAPTKAPASVKAPGLAGGTGSATGPLAGPLTTNTNGSFANAHSASTTLLLGALMLVCAIIRLL